MSIPRCGVLNDEWHLGVFAPQPIHECLTNVLDSIRFKSAIVWHQDGVGQQQTYGFVMLYSCIRVVFVDGLPLLI